MIRLVSLWTVKPYDREFLLYCIWKKTSSWQETFAGCNFLRSSESVLTKIDRSGDSETKMCSEISNCDLILCQNIFCCIALLPCVGENVISGWLLKVLTCRHQIFWVRFFSADQNLFWILAPKWIPQLLHLKSTHSKASISFWIKKWK